MSTLTHCTLQGDSVTFHSTAEYSEFSNLFECEIRMGPLRFPSASHAFHCLGKVEGPYEDWCIGGKFADWDYVLDIVNEHRTKPLRKEFWKKRKLIGLLAKQVIRHPKTFGVRLKPSDSDTKERWFPIFHAKFQGELKSKLLNTSGVLVSLDKKAMKRDSTWGGIVHNGVLYGQNIMGHLLTDFRDSIRPKRGPKTKGTKRPIVEVVGHVTLDEAIGAKFKKAKVEGKIIELA